MSELSTDAEQMLNAVPLTGSVGGLALRRELGLSKNELWTALDELVNAGHVIIGRGRGGSVRRADADQAAFLQALPEDGSLIPNARVREALEGWSLTKYWTVHGKLQEQGLVVVGRGRGGSVGRVVESEVEEEVSIEEKPRSIPDAGADEAEWYPLLADVLRTQWCPEQRFDQQIVEVTASQGSRRTGGTWTRPDITVVSLKRFPFVPGPFFEIWTFEIKRPGDWSVLAIHEASAHGRKATRPFALLVAAESDEPSQADEITRCRDEAARLGVGLVIAYPPYERADWDFVVNPARHEPAPEALQDFLESQLSPESQAELLRREWFGTSAS